MTLHNSNTNQNNNKLRKVHFKVSYMVGVSRKGIWNSGGTSEPDALAFLFIQTCNLSPQSQWVHAEIMTTECALLASNCFLGGLKKKKRKKILLKDCGTKSQHRTKFWSAQRNFKSRKKWLLLSHILLANYMFCCTPVLFSKPSNLLALPGKQIAGK